MRKIFALASVTLAFAAAPAFAETVPACTTAPKTQWMTQDAAKSRAEAMGFEVRRVKIEDTCYEIYAVAKDGKKSEIYLNPVTGELVGNSQGD